LLHPLLELLAHDGHLRRGFDANAHGTIGDAHDGDSHLIADQNPFPNLAT
jgi:hypothetical protein